MWMEAEVRAQLEALSAEVRAARADATRRLGAKRHITLGQLKLREEMYEDMKPLFRALCRQERRDLLWTSRPIGRTARELLLVFMSELIYWEYENSFWQKLDEALQLRESDHHWMRRLMGQGFDENGIQLRRSGPLSERREYVRTIIGESGFSRQLVKQAKQFALWFFEQYPNLDPRRLDTKCFEEILETCPFAWNIEEVFDLLRDMIRSIGRLLREVRRRALTSLDLADAGVLAELETALGFHPVRGIFGFRREQDIRELLESLSRHVTPETLYKLVRRKMLRTHGTLWVITPDGRTLQAVKPNDVPLMYGAYLLRDPHQIELQVVPREGLTVSKLELMLVDRKRMFHDHEQHYAWIHDDEPFVVYQGAAEPQSARYYHIGQQTGYLWYGRRRIAAPLLASRGDVVFAEMEPRHDVGLDPRLRLSADATAMEVTIPPFTCYKPEYAGRTVQLQLNERPIEDTTYVISQRGMLQFQGTRVGRVLPEDNRLQVRLVTVDGDHATIAARVLYSQLPQNLLFSMSNRELISAGHRIYGGERFVLFTRVASTVRLNSGVLMETTGRFGEYTVLQLQWRPDPGQQQPFSLQVGDSQWVFDVPLEAYLTISCDSQRDHFRILEPNCAFEPKDVHLTLHFSSGEAQPGEGTRGLAIILEKDGEFLSDFEVAELQRLGFLVRESATGELVTQLEKLIGYLVGQRLINSHLGTYTCILVLQPGPSADLEILSEAQFALLPQLHLQGSDAIMVEGQEAVFTISCDTPVLAGTDDTPTDVLRLPCKPTVYFDPTEGRLRCRMIETTVRLVYPPVKVAVSFAPQVHAIRLVRARHQLPSLRVTRTEALDTQVALVCPSTTSARVFGPDFQRIITVERDGFASFPLFSLLPPLTKERTGLQVEAGPLHATIEVIWFTEFRFRSEQCRLIQTERRECQLQLRFKVTGPSEARLTFQLRDNQLRFHGEKTFDVQSLPDETLLWPIELSALRGATWLLCTVLSNGQRLDSLEISLSGLAYDRGVKQATKLETLTSQLDEATALELLDVLEFLECAGREDEAQRVLCEMYSPRCLHQIFAQRRTLPVDRLERYFRAFDPTCAFWLYGEEVTDLKRFCDIPAPRLQMACAEALIQKDDGVGVETLIDLMAAGHIPLDEGFQILARNPACTRDMVQDMVQWDALEQKEDAYIDLMIALSHEFCPAQARRARAWKDWKRALQLLSNREVVTLEVVSTSLSGLKAALGVLVGQVPTGEVDFRAHGLGHATHTSYRKLSRLVGKSISVVVTEVDPQCERLTFSEREANRKLRAVVLDSLKPGMVCRAKVTSVSPFGTFVVVNGVEGLIRTKELSWEQPPSARSVPQEGQEIDVYVLRVDRDLQRVDLSLKRLSPNPLRERFHPGQEVKATVTQVEDRGILVSLEGKVNGYVDISELSNRTISHPSEVARRGDVLTLRVLTVDDDKGRLNLSLRQVGSRDLFWGNIKVRP